MSKPAKLSVHRNRIASKRRRDMQKHMVNAAKALGKYDVRAFAIVAITSDGDAPCEWDTGSIMPMWAFAPTVQAALDQDMRRSGVEETWRPELSERERPE